MGRRARNTVFGSVAGDDQHIEPVATIHSVVYAITKSLSENRDALVAEYNSLSPWEPETAWEEMKRGGCPLHPGAEKYYKEAGYMK